MAGQNPRGLKTTSLDQIWDDLKEGIQQIYLKQNMERKKYIQLYTYPSYFYLKSVFEIRTPNAPE